MAHPPPNPTNSHANINHPPPSTSSPPSSTPFTPRSTSIADDSDAEFDPTPLQSPGGPDYDDLPPSYDEAQHQAVSDARNGVVPLDPNQIEAHRLTLNEGPNEPEVWEYRIRGEELDAENERAPEYSNVTDNSGTTTVPVQHVESSSNIPVGRTEIRSAASSTRVDPSAELLDRALNFTRHEPDADAQYAPRLARRVAIPQENAASTSPEQIQFPRAYAKALHAHSIRPAEFSEFLDGLNALCIASNADLDDLLHPTTPDPTPFIVQDYIRGANEAFFAPRGLRVSLQSLSGLVEALNIPSERGQRVGALASAVDRSSTVEMRAQALHPWIEAIDMNVPAPSAQSSLLRDMAEQVRARGEESSASKNGASPEAGSKHDHEHEHEDPPHSTLDDPTLETHRSGNSRRGRRGRGRNGPFGPPGNGPFGLPGFGPPGFGPRSPPGCSPRGPPGYTHNGSGSSQPNNEWAALGQNMGKWGEEFGKRMGEWGQQFGKQAGDWGQDFGQRANTWGQNVGQRASGQRGGSSAQASSSGPIHGHRTSAAQTDDALPPAYQAPHDQESGVFRGDVKTSSEPPQYEALNMSKGKSKATKDDIDDDDDASSISSSSSSDSDSDSSSDSDSDSDDSTDTQATFLKRVASINQQASAASQKGKKPPEEIATERALAIEKAHKEKLDTDDKIAERASKRDLRRGWTQRRRELVREYRAKKKEMRTAHAHAHGAKGKGRAKGKGKAKKTAEWKLVKKEFRERKKELRREKVAARREWKGKRAERMRARREGGRDGVGIGQGEVVGDMVWVVVENLGA
ncbi:hypothetical protein DE146DRAFT_618659 [Phaeosphaeria sp. MPI-PUGE-AT-0046c]|nr:hypothetical protein DE146DRAFT_618659 [Phaeosphaeria sp. MPI-PUGE-AT-0046c]